MIPAGVTEKSYQLILTALSGFPEIKKAILFGSRAKGNFKPGSDIDIAISGENCTNKTAMRLSGILNEEIPIPYHTDVICYDELDHPELKEHIDRVGIIFYSRPK